MQSTTIVPQDNNKIQNEHYNLLVDEIQSTIKEAIFRSRQELIEGHWMVGKLIREYANGEVTNLLHDLAGDVGLSERLLWYSLKCYDVYPDLGRLPEGKNISWNKLVTKYLTESPKEPKLQPVDKNLLKCPNCGFMFSQEDI